MLIQTKLNRPENRFKLIRRSRLEKLLDSGSILPLTLISAPAGYGKSVLVSEWLANRQEPNAWLSLDAEDSDFNTFLTYLLEAIGKAVPGACPETLKILNSEVLPPARKLAGMLINEIGLLKSPLILVLDDFHHISNSEVQNLVSHLLEHPPSTLRLMILTRRDPALPLARLRSYGQMKDIRLLDLQFSTQETEAYMRDVAGAAISSSARDNLQFQLEGWAAGLHLVFLSLRHHKDPNTFLADLKGGIPYLQEFLVSEVLNQQSQEIQHCLLVTSLLNRFCPSLAHAVCGEPETAKKCHCPTFLNHLILGDFFAICLDTNNQWFRYHHWFQQQLQDQLKKRHSQNEIRAIHLRASCQFKKEGLIFEAMQHALHAGDDERAVALVIENRLALLNSDQGPLLTQWLGLLPEKNRQQHLELQLTQAWVFYLQHNFEALSKVLEGITQKLDKKVSLALKSEALFFKGLLEYFDGLGEKSLASHRQGLKNINPKFFLLLSEAKLHFALAMQMCGKTEKALLYLQKTLKDKTAVDASLATRMWGGIAFIKLLEAQLVDALHAARQTEVIAKENHLPYAMSWGTYMRALVKMKQLNVERAKEFFQLVTKNPFSTHLRLSVDAFCGLALSQAYGHFSMEAKNTIKQCYEFVAQLHDPYYFSIASSLEARVFLLLGETEETVRWLAQAPVINEEKVALWWLEVPAITQCRIRIAEGSNANLEMATLTLERFAKEYRATHNNFQTIAVLTLLAIALAKQKEGDEALATLEEALQLAMPGNVIWPFVELGEDMADLLKKLPRRSSFLPFISKIQAATKKRLKSKPSLPEKKVKDGDSLANLTTRECDILEMLALRLRDKEIAQKLFISPQTVKSHLKHIFQKLDAENRQDAVHKARTLGLS